MAWTGLAKHALSCDVMLGLQPISKSSFTDLVVKKVSLRWDACLCIFCESCWRLLNEFMTDWIDKTWINKTWSDKTWINKTWSDKTWINKTLLLARTLRRRGCKLRIRRNSKKLYFSGYPSIQIPLLFSFCVTVVLTSSGIGSLLRRCMTVAVTWYDYNFCHK